MVDRVRLISVLEMFGGMKRIGTEIESKINNNKLIEDNKNDIKGNNNLKYIYLACDVIESKRTFGRN